MRKLNENKYKTGKVITSFSNYVRFINESSLYDPDEVNKKIRRVILWLNINQGFYAELLSHVNIFGSSDLNPKTMCTNGRDIIFHPEFVMRQSEAALRFVLCHEILHCIGDHMNRRGSRDPMGWNIACDYAINPLLKDEAGFEFPVDENGNREGLYDPRFEGMRAEDIYDALEESGELKKLIGDSKVQKTVETTGKVEDEDKELADPDEEMVIQKGDEPGEERIITYEELLAHYDLLMSVHEDLNKKVLVAGSVLALMVTISQNHEKLLVYANKVRRLEALQLTISHYRTKTLFKYLDTTK